MAGETSDRLRDYTEWFVRVEQYSRAEDTDYVSRIEARETMAQMSLAEPELYAGMLAARRELVFQSVEVA